MPEWLLRLRQGLSLTTSPRLTCRPWHDYLAHFGSAYLRDDAPICGNDVSRLVPSGADLWANVVDGRVVITAVRPSSVAAAAGYALGFT